MIKQTITKTLITDFNHNNTIIMLNTIKWIQTFLLIAAFYGAIGQTKISADQAKSIIKSSNIKLKGDALQVAYSKAIVHTASVLSPTQFNGEFGQFNSAFFDIGVGINQSFALPKVYRTKLAVNQQNVKTAQVYAALSEKEIMQQLDILFQNFALLSAKEKLLSYQDSLFNIFVQKNVLRWQNGESDILAKASAEQQKASINRQLDWVKSLKQSLLVDLNGLLSSDQLYVPDELSFGLIPLPLTYQGIINLQHPSLLIVENEMQAARLNTQLQKAAKLPTLSVGYKNVSFRGLGPDNVYYNSSDRFSSFQLGVAAPIFGKSYNAAIEAARVQEDFSSNQYLLKKIELDNQIRQKSILRQELVSKYESFQKESIPNAKLVKQVSSKQFESGEINYLDYVLLNNQAIGIEMELLDLIAAANVLTIELQYLTNNL
jgi:cobalt-zinc-cadmium resistance protein CzcA